MNNYRSIWKYLFKVPHRLDWVDVKGIRTRFFEAGRPESPPLVLLHGTAGSLENFCANVGAYAPHFHIYAIDMVGCGFTDKPPYPYTVKRFAEHVVGFMDTMKITKASFVGVSLGSWVAARAAQDFPGRIDKIVMVAPAGIIPDRAAWDEYVAGVRKRRTQAAGVPTWESIRTVFTHLMLDEGNVIDDLVGVRLEIYQNPEINRSMANLLEPTKGEYVLTEDEWRALPNGILAIAAVDKRDVFLTHAYRIGEIAPHAQVVEITGCDHWAQFEQPDAFNGVTVPFLQGLPIPKRVEGARAHT